MHLFVLLQYLVPQKLLSNFAGFLAECRNPWFKNFAIKHFIKKYKVDLSEAEFEQAEDYANFNLFFTRRLKKESRPIVLNPNHVVSPVDGCIQQFGILKADQLLQAKGVYYDLPTLFGGQDHITSFYDGNFITFYLAPKDYHRVHMPFAGRLRDTIYIPGRLFSVNKLTAEAIPQLFATNERLVAIFDTHIGRMALIFVGAMIVSGIETSWDQPKSHKTIVKTHYDGNEYFQCGDDLGYFKLGSTVIVLFGKDKMGWSQNVIVDNAIKMGELIGSIKN